MSGPAPLGGEDGRGPARRARRRTWSLISAAFAAQVAVSIPELGLPTLAPMVKADLDLSATAVGVLMATVNVGRLAGAYPSGRLIDRVGERPTMVLGTLAAGLAFAATTLAPNAAAMLPALLVAGLMTASATPAGVSLVMRSVGAHVRAVAVGVRQSGVPAGGAVAALALPPLAHQLGWRTAMLAAAGLTVACGLGVRAMLARHPEHRPRPHPRPRRRRPVRSLLLDRNLLTITLWSLPLAGGQYVVVTYLILSLAGEGASVPLAATVTLAAAQLTGIAGRVGWGLLSDRLLGGRRRPALVAISLSGVLGCAILGLCPTPLPAPLLALVAAAVGLSLLGYQGVGLTAMVEASPVASRGAGLGFGLTFISASIIVAPPTFGFLGDLSGSFRAGWLALATLLACSAALALLVREPRPTPGVSRMPAG